MDRNYRRRSRNEDDFVHFILPTLQGSSSQSSERRAIHTSILNGATYVHEALTGHEVLCEWRFHMERSIFQALVRKLCEKHLLQDARYISVQEQVAIFLYAVSKNATNRALQDRSQHDADSISTYFHAVLNAITRLTCNYIQPSVHQHPILRQLKFSYFKVIVFQVLSW
ncbi:hypothetical protein ACQJBY_010842 [Aegilops geniculata]